MKFNKWTLGLAAVGVVSLTSAARADEKPSALQTALSNTTISGYVSASANVGLTGNYANSPASAITFQNDKQNGFNLDVVKLSISKPEDATPWASGYQVDLLFGPDAVGYNPSVNGSQKSDYAIQQAYITLNTPVGNGIDWKFGVFDGPLGYEGFDSGNSPNYTRSWGYTLDHTALTGVAATYKVNDMIALSAGVANTSAPGINNRNEDEVDASGNDIASVWHKDYFGTVAFTAPTSWGWVAGSTLFVGVNYGSVNTLYSNSSIGNTFGYLDGNQINYYAGLTVNTPWKALSGGVAFDYVRNDAGSIGYVNDNDVLALGVYGTYKATDKLSLNGRAEYVESDVYSGGNYAGSGGLVEVTGTVEYDLWVNVQTRVEARWDQNTSASTYNGTYLFGTTERDDVGLYANVIYKF